MDAKTVHAKAIELCKLTLEMTTRAAAGHPSSSLSLAHIVTCLMYGAMRYDPGDPWDPAADRLVLSEGHAVPIVYAAYADLGGMVGDRPANARPLRVQDLEGLRKFDSVLDGHPNPAEGFPFFDAATGSLGMGLSVAAGLALAARLDALERRIYCIIGDGESREGQVAEALDFIADQKLSHVCAIFNCNAQGQAGLVSVQQSPEALAKKLDAYGWTVTTVDGHDPDAIRSELESFEKSPAPFAIIARTVKGWGVEEFQRSNYHGKPLSEDQLPAAFASLDQMRRRFEGQAGHSVERMAQRRGASRPPTSTAEGKIKLPPFGECLKNAGLSAALAKRQLSTRRAYGAALAALGAADPRIVALDGDVGNSTFSEIFARQHPQRFFECKIAEQNMVSAAVGLAAAGKIPFANSFAKFVGRAYDQVELAAISRANIKLVGSHSGLGPASDGPSQMALADVGFFRALAGVDNGRGQPACVLFQPADAVAAHRMTELMANHRGMCYMRTHRPDVPIIYDFEEAFEVGGCKILQSGDAITLVASGFMVHEARRACEELARGGLACTLIDAYSLPLNTAPILDCATRTRGLVLTVEDNYAGGFGAALAEAAAQRGDIRVEQMLVPRIPKSARKPEELLEQYGLSSQAIAERAHAMIRETISSHTARRSI